MLRWVAALVGLLWATAGVAGPREDAAVRDAFFFAYPVTETVRTLSLMEGRAQANGRTVVNRLVHRTTLLGPSAREVTAPNNDTLYSSAWLDVSKGAVQLDIPALSGRYHSVAVLDLFTDNQAVLGTRANGSAGGRYLLVGPNWRGRVSDGEILVRLPVTEAWIIVRVLVDGPADLKAAIAAQAGFKLTAQVATPTRPCVTPVLLKNDPASFLDRVNEALARGPMPKAMAGRARQLSAAGIRPGAVGVFATLPVAMQTAWQAQMPRFEAEMREGLASVGVTRQGWVYPAPGLGRFGRDWLYRSRIALAGLGALPPEEATYLTAVSDVNGKQLDGVNAYRLHVPAGVPVDGFWSVTMYLREDDGRTFLVENPINRYSIGNRTQGLLRNGDGSLDVILSSHQPTAGTANWLPAPAGPFRVSFRAYLPRPDFARGNFALPAIERLP